MAEMHGVDWGMTLQQYLKALGWTVVASIGFAVGTAIALKIFDWFSGNIDEWEEVKKGNMGVSLILMSLILSVAAIVIKVI